MRVPIPDDWDEETDGYCILLACIPNSLLWTAVYRGMFYALTWWKYWDHKTGDIYAVRDITKTVYEGLCVANCNDLLVELQNLVAVMAEIRDKIPDGEVSTQDIRAISSAIAKLDATTTVNINTGCGCEGDCDCAEGSQTIYSSNGAGGDAPQQTVDVF